MKPNSFRPMKVAVVIPCFRCRDQVANVISAMPPLVDLVVVVDDACPQSTGQFVREHFTQKNIHVITHEINRGVGGAIKTGIQWILAEHPEIEIIVKVDGDGQMDPQFIPQLLKPIFAKVADYVKCNRFASSDHIRDMPRTRLFGNMALSFISKLSTGYYRLMDPTNGFLAIHRAALKAINLNKISDRFFFESDLLFRLSLANAKAVDVPQYSKYGSEKSNLKIRTIILEFAFKHLRNFVKRIIYSYFILDFSLASIQLMVGLALTSFGAVFGAWKWLAALTTLIPTPTGTIMISVVTVIVGTQFLLSFFAYDIVRQPELPLQWFFEPDSNSEIHFKKSGS